MLDNIGRTKRAELANTYGLTVPFMRESFSTIKSNF